MDRNKIDARLHKLRADLPGMLADAEDEDDFWPAFAGEADVIEDGAVSAHDCRYVRNQLNRMLQQAGVARRLDWLDQPGTVEAKQGAGLMDLSQPTAPF